jgi:hypothetical protein
VDTLLAALRRAIPGFCERALTFKDFRACCKREGIQAEERAYMFDEYLSRRGRRPRVTINAGLAPLYKTFVGFHALGQWFCHPGDQEFYLGSPGWLHRIEARNSLGCFRRYRRPDRGGDRGENRRSLRDRDLRDRGSRFRIGERRVRIAVEKVIAPGDADRNASTAMTAFVMSRAD